VAPGATFGSAGAINGDIAVRGTLSPGASPGTMTVSGNMILASGLDNVVRDDADD
jgi:fibronectin-binding autotransporter adhesin